MGTLLRAEKTFFHCHSPNNGEDVKLSLDFEDGRYTQPLHGLPSDDRSSVIKLRKMLSKTDSNGQKQKKKKTCQIPPVTVTNKPPFGRSRSVIDEKESNKDFNSTFKNKTKLPKIFKMASTQSIAGARTSSGVDDFSTARTLIKTPKFASEPSRINVLTLSDTQSPRAGDSRWTARTSKLPQIIASDANTPVDEVTDEASDEVDSDIISDFDNDRLNAEREVNADWLLQEKIQEEQRKFERRKNALLVKRVDDPMESLDKRIAELKFMTRPRIDKRPVIDRFPQHLQERILKIKAIPAEEFQRRKRNMNGRQRFAWTVSKVQLILQCFWYRKIYHNDGGERAQLHKRIAAPDTSEASSIFMNQKSSVGPIIETALRMPPEVRSAKDLDDILWLLRTSKAFASLFPHEMEVELARNVSYERYDDGRLVAHQGSTPGRFYYVLGGRVSKIRKIELMHGNINQHVSDLYKGQTTDADEMEHQWMREDILVAKGPLEVLLLEKEAFEFLLTTHKGPPVDFLKSIDLFDEFDAQSFKDNPDAIQYKYHAQGKLVLKDSNRTNWIHIIKSGGVKVVRYQDVLDSELCNRIDLQGKEIEHLMTGRNPSHAKAMLGFNGVQRELQNIKSSYFMNDIADNPFLQTLNIELPDRNSSAYTRSTLSETPMIYRGSESISFKDIEATHQSTTPGTRTATGEKKTKLKLPSINLSLCSEVSSVTSSDYNPHELWLTRERTEVDPHVVNVLMKKKRTKPKPKRKAYLQLDVLKAGDVFGLDHMEPPVASDPPGLTLISDGAEIVKINKRFFHQYATNNTLMKIELMYKKYMSSEDAQQSLYQKETWNQYTKAVWQRITETMKVPSV